MDMIRSDDMNEKTLKQIADKIEKYLQNNHAYEWHIKIEGTSIAAYYTNVKLFTLVYDEDVEDWYVSGEHLYIDMIVDINKILRGKIYD